MAAAAKKSVCELLGRPTSFWLTRLASICALVRKVLCAYESLSGDRSYTGRLFVCVLLQYLLSDKAITDIEVQYVWNIITNAAISRAFIKASSNDQFVVNDSPDVLKN